MRQGSIGGCIPDDRGLAYHYERCGERFGEPVESLPDPVGPEDFAEVVPTKTLKMRMVSDQKALPSCVGNALADMVECLCDRHVLGGPELSRAMPWILGRAVQHGLTDATRGTSIPAAVASLSVVGIAREELVPYTLAQAVCLPTVSAMREAYEHRIFGFYELSGTTSVPSCIMRGVPVVFGIGVGERFQSVSPGEVFDGAEKQILGGHCMLIVGYRPDAYLIRNSWGTAWGDLGYAWVERAWIDMAGYNFTSHDGSIITW